MSDPTEPTEREYLEGLRPEDREQGDEPTEPEDEQPDQPCGLCGGEREHPVHNGETVQGVEPHEYTPWGVVLARVEAQLRALTDDNLDRAKKLARGEPPMQLDSASMSALRLETILNHILPPGSLDRLRFELFFQGEVSKALDEAFSNQAKLRLGVQRTGRTTPKGLHLG